jgi:hypothetical protein
MDFVVSVGKVMVEQNVLTDFGLKILNNDFFEDMKKLDSQEKLVRVSLYMTCVINLTLLYGGYVYESGLDHHGFEQMQTISEHMRKQLPDLLKHLQDSYLEKYHEAKVGLFTKNIFETYMELPLHPEEQKLMDEIGT